MNSQLIKLFVSLAALTMAVGCKSMLKPSDQTRRDAFSHNRHLFKGDEDAAVCSVYFVFSGGPDFQQPQIDRETRKLVFKGAKGAAIGHGLAIALETDGYLLTAGHVLDSNNFVYGWFDGKLEVKPARVVFAINSKTDADVALIKTTGNLDHTVTFGELPTVGDPAFAIVCYHKEKEIGGTIGFTGGTVLDISKDPSGSGIDLVNTTLPLWEGDSGGPQLSGTGQLIGVTTGYEFEWRGVHGNYRRISFFPDKQMVHDSIVEDRARNTPARVP